MVGGVVTESCLNSLGVGKGNAIRLWCIDPNNPHNEMVVFTPIAVEVPKNDDLIWWSGDTIMWTAEDLSFVDRKIEKVGDSFDPRTEDMKP